MMLKIKIDKDKNIIPEEKITYFLNPDFLYIPVDLKDLLVKQNEKVSKNSLISKNIYSPISGIAYGMTKMLINNSKKNVLVIENDFREYAKQEKKHTLKLTIPNLLKILTNTNDKLLLDKFKSKSFDNIVLSAIDDNPYVYNKVFLLKEKIADILELLEQLSIIYASSNILIVVKNNDSTIINECLKVIGTYPKVKLTIVEDEYLLEKPIILKEKLNLQKSTLLLNVFELLKIKNYLEQEKKTTKLITISGNAIKTSKVIRVKKYTLLEDVINKFIEINYPKYEIIVNGLMTGYNIDNIKNVIITDELNSINIMKKNNHKESACIKCGRCVNICPEKVNPLTKENIQKCTDCGLCSYVCPAYINLRKKLKEK